MQIKPVNWLAAAIVLMCIFFTNSSVAIRFVTEDLPPFQIAEQGRIVDGALVEIVRAIIKTADIDAEIEVYPWPRAYKIALENPNTFIFSMRKNEDRIGKFIWLAELYDAKPTLVKLAEREDISIKNTTDIDNFSLAIVRGDNDFYLLNEHNIGRDIYHALSYKELWQMLLKKRVDMIMSTPAVIQQALVDYKLTANDIGIVHQFNDANSKLYLAANQASDPKTIKKIQQAITQLKSEDVFNAILTRWKLL